MKNKEIAKLNLSTDETLEMFVKDFEDMVRRRRIHTEQGMEGLVRETYKKWTAFLKTWGESIDIRALEKEFDKRKHFVDEMRTSKFFRKEHQKWQ